MITIEYATDLVAFSRKGRERVTRGLESKSFN
jgi:hypothetical protein